MSARIDYRIQEGLKNDFVEAVNDKYNRKWGKTKLELENALKLYLTISGSSDYSDDPDVQELLEAARKTPCTHTHTSDHEDDDKDLDTNWNDPEYLEAKVDKAIDERFDEFEKVIKETLEMRLEKIHQDLEKTYSYSLPQANKENIMDTYMIAFLKEYGEWSQVSYNELSSLAVRIHGVTDKRSVQNRINYLVGKGVIKEIHPNVYNILE